MTMSTMKMPRMAAKPSLPPAHDWRTSEADEINKRRQRAREESFVVTNVTPVHPIFSNFSVQSASGLTHSVEVRSLVGRQFAGDWVDFRINGLGVCKHLEAVLLQQDGVPLNAFRWEQSRRKPSVWKQDAQMAEYREYPALTCTKTCTKAVKLD